MNRNYALVIITNKILFCVILGILVRKTSNRDVLIVPVEKKNSRVDLIERIVKNLITSLDCKHQLAKKVNGLS
jgi:tetrahydromethanopterin S-methyltransferase subunit B